MSADDYAERARMALAELRRDENPYSSVNSLPGEHLRFVLADPKHERDPEPMWRCLECIRAYSLGSHSDPSPDGCLLRGMGLRDCGRTVRVLAATDVPPVRSDAPPVDRPTGGATTEAQEQA